jgi:hypothetical protein
MVTFLNLSWREGKEEGLLLCSSLLEVIASLEKEFESNYYLKDPRV